MSQQREILTWEGFGVASHDLALKIAASGFEPDMILAIARGGLASHVRKYGDSDLYEDRRGDVTAIVGPRRRWGLRGGGAVERDLVFSTDGSCFECITGAAAR